MIRERGTSFQWLLGGKFVPASAEKTLAALCDNWEAISGPYSGLDAADASFDFNELVTDCPVSGILHRHGAEIRFEGEFGEARPESDSPIVIEVLLAVGNDLAHDTLPELAGRWRALAAETQLPPAIEEDYDNDAPSRHDAETAFYAKALGHDLDQYRRAAMWLHARQLAFAVRAPGYSEPTREEIDVLTIPDSTPSEPEIDAIYALSIEKIGSSLDEEKQNAVHSRNIDARQQVVFRRFFPQSVAEDEAILASLPRA
jgi:hypothetical protein